MTAQETPIHVVADLGNSFWKIIVPQWGGSADKRVETVIPHAIVEDEGGMKWQQQQVRYKNSGTGDPDWLHVRSSGEEGFFIVGMSAEAYGIASKRTGAAKYERGYMGIALCAALSRVLPLPHPNIHLWVSFPPYDVAHTDQLAKSVIGRWDVELLGGKRVQYHVRTVQVFDEPLGGYAAAAFDWTGAKDKGSFKPGSTLIVDIGGKISNILRILPNGKPAYDTASSVDIGMQDVENLFAEHLKGSYSQLRALRAFDADLVRQAILTGSYQFRGRELDCTESVQYATNTILNRLARVYADGFAGGANDANIAVTGGGGGVLFDKLKVALDHANIRMVEKPGEMHLANARGGAKLLRAFVGRKG